jgi:AraC-like DNA-binding protein
MYNLTLVGTFTLVILVFSFLISIFLFTVNSRNKLSNGILAVYFLVFAFHISVFFYSNFIQLPLVLEMLRDHIIALASPLMFLYLISNIYQDFELRLVHLIHALPLIARILIFTPRFYAASEADQLLFTENFDFNIELKISYVIGIMTSILYLILMFIELKKYKSLLNENYTNTSTFNYKWLWQLTIVITTLFVFSQFKQVYRFVGSDLQTFNLLRLILVMSLLGFLCWIVLKSMYQPELFKGIDTKHTLAKNLLKTVDENDAKTDANIENQLKHLKDFMAEKEPYLDPSLNLQKLANQLDLPSRELSILINHHLKQHFFDFITTYRIKKAIQILENPENKKLTILEILYDVGFNSKSPFNKAFKAHTGQTPSEYRSRI